MGFGRLKNYRLVCTGAIVRRGELYSLMKSFAEFNSRLVSCDFAFTRAACPSADLHFLLNERPSACVLSAAWRLNARNKTELPHCFSELLPFNVIAMCTVPGPRLSKRFVE